MQGGEVQGQGKGDHRRGGAQYFQQQGRARPGRVRGVFYSEETPPAAPAGR